MQVSQCTATNDADAADHKLTLPGLRAKVGMGPPVLERLESFVTSPCVSDATLTSRRLREMIPCTPSPMYAYDSGLLGNGGMGDFDAEGRPIPRFFPFLLNHSIQSSSANGDLQRSNLINQLPKLLHGTSNETILDEAAAYLHPRLIMSQGHLGVMSPKRNGTTPVDSTASNCSSGSSTYLVSPHRLQSPGLTTPIIDEERECILEDDLGHFCNGNVNGLSERGPNMQQPLAETSAAYASDVPATLPKEQPSAGAAADILLERIKEMFNPSGNGSFEIPSTSVEFTPEIVFEIVQLSKDQLGSRFVQHLMDIGKFSVNDVGLIFDNILPFINELTLDPFGNYVVQKLVETPLLGFVNRKVLLEKLRGNIFQYSVHMYGCRVIQKILEEGSLEEQTAVAKELRGNIVKCVEDQNGNHVVQKIIEKIASSDLDFIVKEFSGNISQMAIHCYGCRVVQRLIEKLTPSESRDMIAEILSNLWQLSQDQYGNYVIQHVLLHGSSQHRFVIIQVIASHIVEFSCHKYASNIAEKALVSSANDPHYRDMLIGAVIGSGNPSDSPLLVLMKDRFANYVIQRCIELSQGQQRVTLINLLKANLPMLKRVIYGKHIANAIERIITTERCCQ